MRITQLIYKSLHTTPEREHLANLGPKVGTEASHQFHQREYICLDCRRG